MKKILPVQIWVNGSIQIGSLFQCNITYDNLENSANFYWSVWESDLLQENIKIIANGNLTINDPEYDIWGQSADINQAAYEWCAQQLSLTLIP